MTHEKQYKRLHENLCELLGDFIESTDKEWEEVPIKDLLIWSFVRSFPELWEKKK